MLSMALLKPYEVFLGPCGPLPFASLPFYPGPHCMLHVYATRVVKQRSLVILVACTCKELRNVVEEFGRNIQHSVFIFVTLVAR